MIVVVLVLVTIYLGDNTKKNRMEMYQVVQLMGDCRVVNSMNTEDDQNIDHV